MALFTFRAFPDGRTDAFSAEGEIHSDTALTYKGKKIPGSDTRFKVTVNGDNWCIETERNLVEASTGTLAALMVQVGSTNGEIFSTAYRRPEGAADWSCIAGSARSGPVPYIMLEPSLPMIWVALIAHRKYNSNGRAMLPGIYFPYEPRLYDATFSMPADLVHSDAPPHFISRLTVYLDKWRYWNEGLDSLIMAPLEKPLLSPYQEGCTNFTYSVTQFGGNDMMSWPSHFVFVFYGMKPGASNASDLRLIASSHGTVTRFRTGSNILGSFIPELPQGVLVNDARFIDDKDPVRPITYFSRGGWQPKPEISQSQGFLEEKQKQEKLKPAIQSRPNKQPAGNAGTRRSWIWAAFLGSTICAVFLLAKTRTKT